ncbi:MAG: transcriptional regulator [Crocinitomicaceae bacterium]|jgi:DNA-binding transcriptional ArsR family regulator|uniref:Regulatory ArsR family protein n=2 Tax=Cytophagales TaxID=768507 RepID=A0A3D9KY40_MARFU|nr:MULTISPECIES: metalloregulator ArsR/SmtB family transcription factor [Cytophagales]MAX79807.1 transcriptional regulator [Crocinitomicaceae bacterium]MCB0541280.1 winged helix-turn-helix transcriptional regulator [Bacteroidota bacterium]MCZ4410695.1 metalloregulator ArsR/SmtB family transcription factor [Cryomorphaceae bacterium 1068]MDD4727967.1 metalloregulator ArsR/SmtB family transcription factor [Dysgonamonadaceae bacterium]HAQ71659.1 transcriptional regulator [Flavobacteriales bacteriu|tara:strand:+ start:214 stop:582 length:369 start_codon:yes stop_codon:yes gene_type:complete
MTKTCIRVYADEKQIKQCKQDIEKVGDAVNRIARALNLAGNEVRLKILFLLDKESKMCPCDLSDILGMTVPAISQHLRKLKDAGLVETNKVGQTIFYSISESNDLILNPILGLLTPEKESTI